MEKGRARKMILLLSLVSIIGLSAPGGGYSQFQPGVKGIVGEGQEAAVKGAILNRDGDTMVVRDLSRMDTTVVLTPATEIRTERKWIIFGAKPFDAKVLIPGLIVTAEGKGGARGNLVADLIEFSEEDLNAAMTAYAQTVPIAMQAAENKKQLSETQKHLSETQKQLSETEKKLAETSKELVDTKKRINEIDQYDLVRSVAVLFALNSAKLSDDAKAQLDDLAARAPGAKNYLVEIQGYADTIGTASKNLELSRDRAHAVVQYLTVKHGIPLRRITIPMGYGETKASDTSTAAARAQERRVEVRVLVNKGLNQ